MKSGGTWHEAHRHNRRLHRVVACVLRDEAEVEDTIQQAYVSAFLNLEQFASRSSFATWLTRIALHEALACRVRRSRARAFVDAPSSGATLDPERLASAKEAGAAIERALRALSEPYRIVFVLRAIEGLAFAEVGSILELSEKAAKVRFHRARHQLGGDVLRRLGASRDELLAFGGARCARLTAATLEKFGRVLASSLPSDPCPPRRTEESREGGLALRRDRDSNPGNPCGFT